MLAQMQQRKWYRLFQVYDADRNGVVEKNDFEEIFQNLATARDLTPGSPEYEELHGRFMEDWENLRKDADKNNDRKVELAEWLEHGDRRVHNRDMREKVVELADRIFELLDLNGDGIISVEEYKTFFRSWRLPEELAVEIFPQLDLNGDGVISKDELLELVKQFHHSNDWDAPGNFLFGPY